ncbi:hypothetical protein DPMN_058353 [Dreissena polymorpha]|uniref:Uncharacterized protein n=1 Tax=Dreissena polymorpha TaxID=45954 RepID=A0A9D4HG11_DREPO|nr:hypothetical protein DPMN_058353 [Dreissena polymorpha]
MCILYVCNSVQVLAATNATTLRQTAVTPTRRPIMTPQRHPGGTFISMYTPEARQATTIHRNQAAIGVTRARQATTIHRNQAAIGVTSPRDTGGKMRALPMTKKHILIKAKCLKY